MKEKEEDPKVKALETPIEELDFQFVRIIA